MPLLTNLTLVNAKLEGVFRTDSEPNQTLQILTPIDATADVDAALEEITFVAHGYTTGTGPVQLTILTGALPDPLLVLTDYWVIRVNDDDFQLATTRAFALAGTAIDLTVAVGTFTLTKQQSDAFLVIDPDYSPDITILDRDVVASHLSEVAGSTGRKLGVMTFQTEIRSNGTTDAVLAPATGVLLRGCGMAQTKFGETGNEVETIIDDVAIPINDPTGTFTYVKGVGYGGTRPRVVVLRCTTGGGTGVAAFTVYSPPVGNQAGVLTSGVVMTDDPGTFILAESASITPTIGVDFAVGDTYVINVAPAGHFYLPVSTGVESLSLEMFFAGLKHSMTGARGTFTAEGEAGAFGTFSWTFTGDFVTPTDEALPSDQVFETQVPQQVELANVAALGGVDFPIVTDLTAALPTEFALCAQAFGFDIGNDVQPRECINGANSLEGAVITDRSASATFNPESELVAAHPFWTILENANRIFFAVRVGVNQGNVVQFHGLFAQYTGISYSDRANIRANDMTLRLAASTDAGDDELRISFC